MTPSVSNSCETPRRTIVYLLSNNIMLTITMITDMTNVITLKENTKPTSFNISSYQVSIKCLETFAFPETNQIYLKYPELNSAVFSSSN